MKEALFFVTVGARLRISLRSQERGARYFGANQASAKPYCKQPDELGTLEPRKGSGQGSEAGRECQRSGHRFAPAPALDDGGYYRPGDHDPERHQENPDMLRGPFA